MTGLIHGELCTLHGHLGDVYCVVFSSDGRLLASCGMDKTARIWDVATRQELRRLEGHTDEINAMAFSPDDRLLATASDDSTVKIWEVATCRCTRTLIGHKKQVNTVAFTRDGRHVMSADRSPTPFRPDPDLRLILWDIESARPSDAQAPGVLMVETQVISRDGSTIAVGGPEGVRVWGNEAGQNSRGGPALLLRRPRVPSERDPAREPVGISTDGRWIAIRTVSDKIAVYECDSETPPRSYECGNGQAKSVAFSPDGRSFATSSHDGVVRLYDRDRPVPQVLFFGHEERVWSVAFSPDGKLLASAGRDGTIKLWEPAQTPGQSHLTGPASVPTIEFGADGRSLAVITDSGAAQVLDIQTGSLRFARPAPGESHPQRVHLARSGAILATASNSTETASSALTLVDLKGRKGERTVSLPPGSDCISVLSDGRILVKNAPSLTISKQDPDSGQVLWERPARPSEWAYSVSRDEHWMSTVRPDTHHEKPLELWDLARGAVTVRARPVMNTYVASSLSDDGLMLATWGEQGVVQVWNAATLDAMAVLRGHTRHASCAVFSPDGKTLATGDFVGFIRLWNVATWREFFTLAQLDGPVHCLRFSPDGKILAAASAGTKGGPCLITLWHAAERSASEVRR
jgi:WD40 repeat protein